MGQQLSDKIVGPLFFGDPRQAGEGVGPPVRAPHDHRSAHVRPELGLHRTAAGRRRGRPRVVRSRAAARRDRGPGRPAERERAVVPAGRRGDHRQDDVPPGPDAQHGRRRATPRSSTRTRSASTSGRARPSCRSGRSRSTARSRPRSWRSASTSARSASRASRSSSSPWSRRPSPAATSRSMAASRASSTGCRRSSCST